MSQLSLTIETPDGSQSLSFKPGDTLRGKVLWQTQEASSLEVRLFWFTQGRGDEDVGIINSMPFPSPKTFGSSEFSFPLPNGPYSFSGALISLTWAVEAILSPSEEVSRKEFTLSPDGTEILLKKT